MPNPTPDRDTVLAWLESYDGTVPFLVSVRDWYVRNRCVTDRQYSAVYRNYVRMVVNAGTPDENLPEPATGYDVPTIRNGVYTIDDGNEHLTFQVYTATRGNLAGKRIVKRQTQYGRYQGFGFLTTDGELRVWQRYIGDEEARETYIVWAKALLSILNQSALTEQTGTIRDEMLNWRISFSTVCRVCNRRLTTPTSCAIGIGPECHRRETEETTAADAHAPISTTDAAIEMQRAQRAAEEARERAERQERALQLTMSQLDPSIIQ